MKKHFVIGLLLCSVLAVGKTAKAACNQPVVDARDNSSYQTVSIGSQCWLAENLHYQTGVSNVQKNGSAAFYTWHDAMANVETAGTQGICPSGWHIPTEAEWLVAAQSAGDNNCRSIGYSWGTQSCPTAGTLLKNLLNINNLTYGQKASYGASWWPNETLFWTSSVVTSGSTQFIKDVTFRADNQDFGAYLLTDVMRKSWDVNDGWNYGAVRCVQNSSTATPPAATLTCYADSDNDGYGAGTPVSFSNITTCPYAYAAQSGDCDNSNAYINPGLNEVCGNSSDDNCNGRVNENCDTGTGESSASCGAFTDLRDNKNYQAAAIGTKCWMAEDLKFVQGLSDVRLNNGNAYYTWHDAMANSVTAAARGICPVGWHLPTEADWVEAAQTSSNTTCSLIGDSWGTYNCLTAAPALKRALNINQYTYGQIGYSDIYWNQGIALYWTSTLQNNVGGTNIIKNAYLSNSGEYVNAMFTDFVRQDWDSQGNKYLPVRCIKDSADSGTFTKTVIGNTSKITCYRDGDNDGYGLTNNYTLVTGTACPAGYSKTAGDCNDAAIAINPGKTEVCGNNIDDNCNGQTDEACTSGSTTNLCYYDYDRDGYGLVGQTKAANANGTCATRYAKKYGDCNDKKSAINPGAVELCGNKVDDDCDGKIDEDCKDLTCYYDSDGDKFGNPKSSRLFKNVTQCSGKYVADKTDCNDSNSRIKPGVAETCSNKVDDNCNGKIDEDCPVVYCYYDKDLDGYGDPAIRRDTTSNGSCAYRYVKNNTDCNDSVKAINPGVKEICTNNIDDNCNGQVNENCTTTTLSSGSSASGNNTTLLDTRNNKSYPTKLIGNKLWMMEDLKYDLTFGNVQKSGTYYYYNWHDAVQTYQGEGSQGICPSGWHIPSEAEWVNAAETVSGKTCQKINDIWSSAYCEGAGGDLRTALNLSTRYGWMVNGAVTWKNGDSQIWTSTDFTRIGQPVIKLVMINGANNASFANYFFTDVLRKSWDTGNGYYFLPIRCVKD